jgi:hypothetical protein
MAIRRKKKIVAIMGIRHSCEALEKGLKEVDENGSIYFGKLPKLGFIFYFPTNRVTTKNSEVYKSILDIAFKLSENKNYIRIFKLKQNGIYTN